MAAPLQAATAKEFWDYLSPEKPLFPEPCTLLYRGQADARWHLTPGILRGDVRRAADEQVLREYLYLEKFVHYCDSIGLAIPNDSPTFRKRFLDLNGPVFSPSKISDWPPEEMHPLMALAQHHRLPTRLLDWSTRAYVAAYFAISDALTKKIDAGTERLAVWVLDIAKGHPHFPELKVVTVPGSNSANLAAQSGRFTLLAQKGYRTKPFEGPVALDLYFDERHVPAPLKKVTLPITEAAAALKLCGLYGLTGATMFPDYDGVARATKDAIRYFGATKTDPSALI